MDNFWVLVAIAGGICVVILAIVCIAWLESVEKEEMMNCYYNDKEDEQMWSEGKAFPKEAIK